MAIIKKYEQFLCEGDDMEKTTKKEGELLFKMEKPRSPQHVEVRRDIDFDDMLRVFYKDKNGGIKSKHLITSSSFDSWINPLKESGFIIDATSVNPKIDEIFKELKIKADKKSLLA